MKKLIFVFMIVGIIVCPNAFATGDKTITSQKYVENQVATKQDKIPAVDTNTVITHTGTAGNIGEKGIYDSNGDFVSQYSSLVTAGDANTGINTALENEFVCVEFDSDGTCLIWEIKTRDIHALPSGYTQLEYLESSGTQYIDTGVVPTFNTGVLIRASFTIWSTDDYDNNVIFGATNAENFTAGAAFSIDIFPNQSKIAMPHGGGPDGSYVSNYIWQRVVLNQPYNFSINYRNNGKAAFDSFERPLDAASTMTTRSLYLFNLHTVDGSAYYVPKGARIYRAVLSEGNNISHNYVPARRDSDSILGMYDLVSGTFLINAGSGTFIAGPVASHIPQNQ